MPLFDAIPAWAATLLAALLGGLLLLYVHRLNAFRTASLSFRAAFSPEVAVLQSPIRSDDMIGAYDILRTGFARHHEAVITFRNSVPWYRVSAFDRAWQEYHHHQCFDPRRLGFSDSENLSHLTEYLALNQDEENRARELSIRRIEHLLSFSWRA